MFSEFERRMLKECRRLRTIGGSSGVRLRLPASTVSGAEAGVAM